MPGYETPAQAGSPSCLPPLPWAGDGARGRSGGATERQVAETHALIASIQSQIQDIKGSLGAASTALCNGAAERGGLVRRLEALEDRQVGLEQRQVGLGVMATAAPLDAATVEGMASLGRRVKQLEARLASEGSGCDGRLCVFTSVAHVVTCSLARPIRVTAG